MFFSSCNIRAFYTRENKPRLTLATVYKIRKWNYLYKYIFLGQYKPRLEKDVNVDFVFESSVSRGQRKPWLIFSRINGGMALL